MMHLKINKIYKWRKYWTQNQSYFGSTAKSRLFLSEIVKHAFWDSPNLLVDSGATPVHGKEYLLLFDDDDKYTLT